VAAAPSRFTQRAGVALIEQRPELARRITPDLPLVLADLLLCARDEMVVQLSDLLRRRMPLLILARLDEGNCAVSRNWSRRCWAGRRADRA